ncbi:MAG: trimethylamine methyltransferase family protein, partial [Pseudomonadota bacterium]
MGIKNVVYPLKVISDDEVKKIYHGSLAVLERTGVLFEDRQIALFLQEHGCIADLESGRVTFPPETVEECLKKCPREFTVRARNTKYNLLFNGSRVYFASHSAPNFIDPETGLRRSPSLRDVGDMVTLIDAMENI